MGFDARAQSAEKLHAQAISDYKTSQMQSAIARLKSLEQDGIISSDLFYNLGTIYLKNDSIAQAVYYLEKAKRLQPSNSRIVNNYELALESTIDKMKPKPQLFFNVWWWQAMTHYNTTVWAIFSLVFFWILMLSIILQLRLREVKKWKTYTAMALSGTLCIVFLVFAYQYKKIETSNNTAIVMQAKVKGYEQPFTNAEEAFVVHEGCKLLILETQADFAKVALIDGREGWIATQAFKRL